MEQPCGDMIQIRIDSLTEIDSTLAVLEELTKLNNDLASADKSMMDWMHQFSIDSLDKMEVGAKMIYLQKQYEQLTGLQKLTDSTLHAAQTYKP